MATDTKVPSMNEANPRDPFNNNSYGTLVDSGYKMVSLPILDVNDFNERIIRSYEEGTAEKGLPADLSVARSLIPAGTATLRDFSYIAPDIPEYIPSNCTGCMDCVTLCPDTAILGKVLGESEFEKRVAAISDPTDREAFRKQWSKTRKYYEGPAKKVGEGGLFSIMIDPSKCKGCAECVTVCDDLALKMIPKTEQVMTDVRKSHRWFKQIGPSDHALRERQPAGRHDAQGANARLHRRRRQLRRLRRGDRTADDVRRHRRQVRRRLGHRGRHRLQHGLYVDVSLQSVPRAVDQFAVRKCPGHGDGRPRALGSDGLGQQADLVHRRRRRDVRHRLPIAVAHVRLRHEHQSVRARYAGLFQHRRPGFHFQLHRPEHEDERAWQGNCRQAGAAQGNRADRHDAPAHVRGANHLRPHQPFLSQRAWRRWSSTDRRSSAASRPASPSTAWPTTWPPIRRGWRSTRGRSRC